MLDIFNSSPPDGQSDIFHADALPIGTLLGEFEILGLLGVGGFGMVYNAYDRALRRGVAIKEYLPSSLASRSNGLAVSARSAADQQTLASGLSSFVAEARLLAQFDHPSLVKVYRFWEANNTAYMVMPLYRGLTFRQARAQMQAPPSEAWMRSVLWSILGALKYMHEHKTVHRDISPDNIFLQDKGPPVLLDLGAARRAIADSNHKHTAILKVNYAPIEQYAESPDMRQGPWTDLYSLAAVVHGCLCNAPPLPATFRVVRDRMPPFASVAHTVKSLFGQHYSREFVQTIAHALAIQPEARPQSVQAFMDEMHLTVPEGIQTFSWREGLSTSRAPVPVVDPNAKTVLHETLAPVAADEYELPASEAMPLSHMSAYGELDQESAFLATQLVLDSEPELENKDAREGVATGKNAVRTAQPPVKTFKFAAAGIAGLVLAAGLAAWFWGGPSKVVPIATEQSAPAQLPAVAVTSGASPDAGGPGAVVTTAPIVASSAVPIDLTVQAKKEAPLNDAGPRLSATPILKKSPQGVTRPAPAARARASPDAPVVSGPNDKSGETLSNREDVAQLQPEPSKPAPAARPGPAEICASRNFVVRPMCIFRECQKPEFARNAFCEDARRRWKDENPSNSP